jgi:NADP-dependent alcohol dehydrogenase
MQFQLCNPTDIRFGKGQIAALTSLISPDARILLLYGGGSIKQNGVYEQVMTALAGFDITEFGGIEVNPVYETLQRAARLGRQKKVDFVLGVGGGSVIDASKFLAVMIATGEEDPWDRLVAGGKGVVPLPNGAVLTLPATGSESNPTSVISSTGRHLKIPFQFQSARPRFAVMDPTTMQSLSRRQLENGVVDSFIHVLEQYLTLPVNAPVQFGFSETLLSVLLEWGPVLVEKRSEEACENVMWAANQALNGLIGAGVPQDWSTHMIGHAITALYGIDHARTLTMILPALLRYKKDAKLPMLARFARRVWKIDEADDAIAAELAIRKTEDFMRSMSCPVRISDARIDMDVDALIKHLADAHQTSLGESGDIRADDVRSIVAMAA